MNGSSFFKNNELPMVVARTFVHPTTGEESWAMAYTAPYARPSILHGFNIAVPDERTGGPRIVKYVYVIESGVPASKLQDFAESEVDSNYWCEQVATYRWALRFGYECEPFFFLAESEEHAEEIFDAFFEHTGVNVIATPIPLSSEMIQMVVEDARNKGVQSEGTFEACYELVKNDSGFRAA